MASFRGFGITSLVMLVGFCFGQDLSKKITYTTVAAPAKRVLAELTKLSGVELQTAPQTDNDILLVSVTDVTLESLMKQIAAATSAEWKQEGQIFRLIAGSARQREDQTERQVEIDANRKSILDEFAKVLKPPAENDKSGAPAVGVTVPAFALGTMMGPSAKAVAQIAQGADVNLLAGLRPGDRVVFSTNPTRMQRPLGGNVWPIVNQLVEEHNKTVSEAAKAESDTTGSEGIPDAMKPFMDRFKPKPISGTAVKVLLIASRNSMIGSLQLTVRSYDNDGKVGLNETSIVNLGGGLFDFAAMATQAKGGKAPKKDEKAIEFSPVTKEISAFFSQAGMGAGLANRKLSAEALAMLERPDLYDPLSFKETELLMAVARAKNEPIVAEIPDETVSMMGMAMGGSPTVSSVLTDLKDGKAMRLAESEGWLVIKPMHPSDARARRLDRSALAALIAVSKGKDVPSLDDIAAYAQKADDPMKAPISMAYLITFAPGAMNMGMTGMTSWDMIRFYGTMSATQRQSFTQGGRVSLGALTTQQANLAYRLLFGADAHLAVTRPGDKKDPLTSLFGMDWMDMFTGGSATDYRDEPTEIMPNGIPPSGVLQVQITSTNIAKPVGDSGTGLAMMGVMGPDELAMLKFFKEDVNMQQVSSAIPSLGQVKIGNRTVYKFEFLVAPGVAANYTLNDNSVPKDAAIVAADKLPDAFQKQVNDRLEAFKKSPFGSMMGSFGMMGRGTPPPRS